MRMHKNRKVFFNNKHQVLAGIKELQLKGRYKARTIKVVWHELALYITAHKRIDKHNEATIVYQVATYQAAPSEHVSNYKKRWPIEKMFRTSKQFLGLQECFSTKLDKQLNHVSSVLVAYALLNIKQKTNHFKTPEDALRYVKSKKIPDLESWICSLSEIFQ